MKTFSVKEEESLKNLPVLDNLYESITQLTSIENLDNLLQQIIKSDTVITPDYINMLSQKYAELYVAKSSLSEEPVARDLEETIESNIFHLSQKYAEIISNNLNLKSTTNIHDLGAGLIGLYHYEMSFCQAIVDKELGNVNDRKIADKMKNMAEEIYCNSQSIETTIGSCIAVMEKNREKGVKEYGLGESFQQSISSEKLLSLNGNSTRLESTLSIIRSLREIKGVLQRNPQEYLKDQSLSFHFNNRILKNSDTVQTMSFFLECNPRLASIMHHILNDGNQENHKITAKYSNDDIKDQIKYRAGRLYSNLVGLGYGIAGTLTTAIPPAAIGLAVYGTGSSLFAGFTEISITICGATFPPIMPILVLLSVITSTSLLKEYASPAVKDEIKNATTNNMLPSPSAVVQNENQSYFSLLKIDTIVLNVVQVLGKQFQFSYKKGLDKVSEKNFSVNFNDKDHEKIKELAQGIQQFYQNFDKELKESIYKKNEQGNKVRQVLNEDIDKAMNKLEEYGFEVVNEKGERVEREGLKK